MNMITSIIDASFVSKTELASALGFDSRSTLYARLEEPQTFTIGEVDILSKKLKLPINKVTAIILNDKEVFNAVINNVIKRKRGAFK